MANPICRLRPRAPQMASRTYRVSGTSSLPLAARIAAATIPAPRSSLISRPNSPAVCLINPGRRSSSNNAPRESGKTIRWPAACLLTFPPPRKIIQLPGLVVILSERDVTFQQIFTDGRPLPKDPSPNWNGYSVGSWEGDTLVVHTTGLRDGTWIDRKGNPLTDAASLTERFHRVNYGRLEIDLTVNDPKAYTKPWTVRLNQVLAPDTDLLDYFCMDNEKDALHIDAK